MISSILLLRPIVRAVVAVGLLASLAIAGRAESADPGAAALQSLVEDLREAMTAGDVAKAAAITRGLLPDEARIGKGLGPAADAATRARIVAFHASLPKDDAKLAGLLAAKSGQTEVKVHGSGAVDLAIYAEGSAAYAEFPGAAQGLALNGILAPEATFYEVEFLAPGEGAGTKYHLFFWDGSAWTMLGPIWRALK